MDTLGPVNSLLCRGFHYLEVICIAIYLDPQKQSVTERCPLLGEFVSTEHVHVAILRANSLTQVQ